MSSIFLKIFNKLKQSFSSLEYDSKANFNSNSYNHSNSFKKSYNMPFLKEPSTINSSSYIPSTNRIQVEMVFRKFRDNLITELNLLTRSQHGSISYPSFFKDSGKTQNNLSYFYIQPYNQSGFLFEETSSGWTLTVAKYNVEDKTYIKDKEILEKVTVFTPKLGVGNIRISSSKMKLDLINFAIYEKRIVKEFSYFLEGKKTILFDNMELKN